jgi:hypothetical protein
VRKPVLSFTGDGDFYFALLSKSTEAHEKLEKLEKLTQKKGINKHKKE